MKPPNPQSDPRNLDPLAAARWCGWRIQWWKSRDDDLNVTVCSGASILELPPWAENAFDGRSASTPRSNMRRRRRSTAAASSIR